MRRACCDTLEEHGIDSHLDNCEHFPPKRYTQADLARAVEVERGVICELVWRIRDFTRDDVIDAIRARGSKTVARDAPETRHCCGRPPSECGHRVLAPRKRKAKVKRG